MRTALFLIAAGVLAVAGCGKSDPYVGEWKGVPAPGSGLTPVGEQSLLTTADGAFTVRSGPTTFSGKWERTEKGILLRADTLNGKPTAGQDGMTINYALAEDGKLKSDENPTEFVRK